MAITVAVDWNRDGTWTTTGHDVTAYVRARTSPIFCEYGRDQSTALSPTVAGRGGFTLDNSSKRFSPRNTASPLYGTLKPARPVKITRSVTMPTGWSVNYCTFNPSFETAYEGTGARSTVTTDTAWSSDGAQSIKITPTNVGSGSYAAPLGQGDANGTSINRLGLTKGGTYTISATIRMTAAQTGTLDTAARSIAVVLINTAGVQAYYAFSPQATNAAGVTTLSVTVAVPLDCQDIVVRLFNGSTNVVDIVWWDDLKVHAVVANVTLFSGHNNYAPINPDIDSKTVSLSLIDWLGDFRGQTITTLLYKGIRTGEAIGYVLDAVGWAGGRDIDPGTVVIPFWWEDGTDAFDALEKIIRSEGPPALLTVGADGGIVFRDRHHRIIRAASTTVQGTWRANPDAAQPIMQRQFNYDEAWQNIVNAGSAPVDVRIPIPRGPVWTSDVILDLGANEARTIIMTTTDPYYDLQPPRVGTDYELISGSVSQVQLYSTSGASTIIVITAGAGGAKIDKLQVRATSVPVAYTVSVTATDSTSVTDYGKRGIPGELQWCGPHDAQAVLDSMVQQYKQPNPILSVTFQIGRDATKAAMLLTRNLSDRVRVIEPETSLDHEFYIESIRHELAGEHDHTITFGLELCPTVTPTGTDVFLFGGTTGHQFGTGKFAS